MAWAGMESKYRSLDTVAKEPAMVDCQAKGQRQCEDGTCIPRTELCQEEEVVSQETILIMIGVALGIFLLLVFLYCLQQHHSASSQQPQGENAEEPNHPALLLIPPPAYNEAVNVTMYPPTPSIECIISASEEPTTPPPNYDTALHILAQSEENLLVSRGDFVPEPAEMRRAVSADHLGISRLRPMTFSSFGANSKTFTKKPPNVRQAK